MTDLEAEELKNLQIEYDWFMEKEVRATLRKLLDILMDCNRRFPPNNKAMEANDGSKSSSERYLLTGIQDQLKCNVTLTGDNITQADIGYKLKRSSTQVQRTSITNEHPWKLQQIQDARNHLQMAIKHLRDIGDGYEFKSTEDVLQLADKLMGILQRSRSCLITPKKRTVDELMSSKNMKTLVPNLPDDQAISFFLQCHKLVIAVYQVLNVQGTLKMEAIQAECSVEWLNQILVSLTIGLTTCQQLKSNTNAFKMDGF